MKRHFIMSVIAFALVLAVIPLASSKAQATADADRISAGVYESVNNIDASAQEHNPLSKVLEFVLDSVKNVTEAIALVVFIVIGLAVLIAVAAIVCTAVKIIKRKRNK